MCSERETLLGYRAWETGWVPDGLGGEAPGAITAMCSERLLKNEAPRGQRAASGHLSPKLQDLNPSIWAPQPAVRSHPGGGPGWSPEAEGQTGAEGTPL